MVLKWLNWTLFLYLIYYTVVDVDSVMYHKSDMDPRLFTLGNHMFLPDLLSQLDEIAAEGHQSSERPLCDNKTEAIVSQCGINDLLRVFYPASQVVNGSVSDPDPQASVTLRSNSSQITTEEAVKELCFYYNEFQQCIQDFGILQTCTPRYLSTVDVLAEYSCGMGQQGLTQSLDCIANKLTWSQVTSDITSLPGCSNAVPSNIVLMTTRAWYYYQTQYANDTFIPVKVIMSIVCTQWSIYNQCYLPVYHRHCGEEALGYFKGLNEAVKKDVQKTLRSMGPKYKDLGLCNDDTKPVYDVLKMMDLVFRPLFPKWEHESELRMNTSARVYGKCSAAAILDRYGYCAMQALAKMPPLPPFSYVNTMSGFGDWMCKSALGELSSCWSDISHHCAQEEELHLSDLMTNFCLLQGQLNRDPNLYCFPWDDIQSNPKLDMFTQCNITVQAELAAFFDIINHCKSGNGICDKKCTDLSFGLLSKLECTVKVGLNMPNISPIKCGQDTIGYFKAVMNYSLDFMLTSVALVKDMLVESCHE